MSWPRFQGDFKNKNSDWKDSLERKSINSDTLPYIHYIHAYTCSESLRLSREHLQCKGTLNKSSQIWIRTDCAL